MSLTETEVFGNLEGFYSGSVDNVRRVVDAITIGEDGNRSSFNESTCKRYQREVNRLIDNRLSPYYAVPLVKAPSNGFFPEPIPSIAVRLVAANIVLSEYSEIDANSSEAAKDFKEAALDELDRLTMAFFAGTQRLRGQRIKSRGRFYTPTIAPQAQSPDLR